MTGSATNTCCYRECVFGEQSRADVSDYMRPKFAQIDELLKKVEFLELAGRLFKKQEGRRCRKSR